MSLEYLLIDNFRKKIYTTFMKNIKKLSKKIYTFGNILKILVAKAKCPFAQRKGMTLRKDIRSRNIFRNIL